MDRLPFRRDVEGLRALGVLAVLIFHTGFRRFLPGGFAGVDIFFVISGFLITSNILAQAGAGTFSFSGFYVRRIRRLFPALLCTIAVTLVASAIFSAPGELAKTAESTIAATFSVSNIYFWRQASYFDQGAVQKPLLHTWSLAVEEQFYLVWPAVIVGLVRLSRRAERRPTAAPAMRVPVALVLGAIVLVSTIAAEWVLDTAAPQAFYLTPYRMGEFALGALCAWVPRPRDWRPATRDSIAVLGLVMMLATLATYTGATRFPGLSALLPCLGAALLIHVDGSRVATAVLASGPVVAIGRISYSLYLVHWPLAVWLEQWRGTPTAWESAALVLVSIALAGLLHRVVETPFRLGGEPHRTMPTRRFAGIFATASLVITTLAVVIAAGQGWPWRFPESLARFAREAENERNHRFEPYLTRCTAAGVAPCDQPAAGVNVAILGDSHSPDALNAMLAVYPDYHYLFFGLQACPPMTRGDAERLLSVQFANRDGCMAHNARLLEGGPGERSILARVDLVIINVLFNWYGLAELEHTVAAIHEQSHAPVLVFGNYLVFDEDVPDMVLRHRRTRMDPFYARKLADPAFKFERDLAALAPRAGFTFVSKQRLFCGGEIVTNCPLVFDNTLFTYDRHHLSLTAARALGRALQASFGQVLDALPQRPDHATVTSMAFPR